jgi:hypothetical protein
MFSLACKCCSFKVLVEKIIFMLFQRLKILCKAVF